MQAAFAAMVFGVMLGLGVGVCLWLTLSDADSSPMSTTPLPYSKAVTESKVHVTIGHVTPDAAHIYLPGSIDSAPTGETVNQTSNVTKILDNALLNDVDLPKNSARLEKSNNIDIVNTRHIQEEFGANPFNLPERRSDGHAYESAGFLGTDNFMNHLSRFRRSGDMSEVINNHNLYSPRDKEGNRTHAEGIFNKKSKTGDGIDNKANVLGDKKVVTEDYYGINLNEHSFLSPSYIKYDTFFVTPDLLATNYIDDFMTPLHRFGRSAVGHGGIPELIKDRPIDKLYSQDMFHEIGFHNVKDMLSTEYDYNNNHDQVDGVYKDHGERSADQSPRIYKDILKASASRHVNNNHNGADTNNINHPLRMSRSVQFDKYFGTTREPSTDDVNQIRNLNRIHEEFQFPEVHYTGDQNLNEGPHIGQKNSQFHEEFAVPEISSSDDVNLIHNLRRDVVIPEDDGVHIDDNYASNSHSHGKFGESYHPSNLSPEENYPMNHLSRIRRSMKFPQENWSHGDTRATTVRDTAGIGSLVGLSGSNTNLLPVHSRVRRYLGGGMGASNSMASSNSMGMGMGGMGMSMSNALASSGSMGMGGNYWQPMMPYFG